MKKKWFNYKRVISIVLFIYSLAFIFPLLLLFSISFSSEIDIKTQGFSFIPLTPTLEAYKTAFNSGHQLVDAYLVTIIYAVVGTVFWIIVMAMCGYALSCKKFPHKKWINVLFVITMFVNAGLVPSYIINTQVYGLYNNMWIYLIVGSGGVTVTTVFIFRTFFAGLPEELKESASLDGATEMQILVKIIIPLSKPVIMTYGLFGLIARWNDYETSLYYITDTKLYSLQYLLQLLLKETELIKKSMALLPNSEELIANMPTESLKFAICILAALPMFCVFPFMQKFYSKGMMVGSVKG